MKICFYVMREYDELPYVEQFAKEYGYDYVWTAGYPEDDGYDVANGCDAVDITPCDLGAHALEEFAKRGVKYLLLRSVGYDHVDLKRAAELGIRVANVSYPPTGVASYAVMMMLMLARRMQPILRRAAVQDFSLKGKIGQDISVMTVGVIGTGKIGTTVLKNLSGFGCRLICYDPYQNDTAKQYAEYVDLETLFRESDIITLHTNATEENHHLLNKDSFALMKDGVLIVNTARGKLINAADLIDALESGKVGGAALDVLEIEDGLYYYNRVGDVIANRQMAVLRSFPNVIMSPHTAFYTTTAVKDMVLGAFEALKSFEAGEESVHEVKAR